MGMGNGIGNGIRISMGIRMGIGLGTGMRTGMGMGWDRTGLGMERDRTGWVWDGMGMGWVWDGCRQSAAHSVSIPGMCPFPAPRVPSQLPCTGIALLAPASSICSHIPLVPRQGRGLLCATSQSAPCVCGRIIIWGCLMHFPVLFMQKNKGYEQDSHSGLTSLA